VYEALLEQDGISLDPRDKPHDPGAGGAVREEEQAVDATVGE
jgi:hypothetical protein